MGSEFLEGFGGAEFGKSGVWCVLGFKGGMFEGCRVWRFGELGVQVLGGVLAGGVFGE